MIVYKYSLKMAAPLPNCTVLEVQTVINFFFLQEEDFETSEIYSRMLEK